MYQVSRGLLLRPGSASLPELEHDFVLSNHPELPPRDALDGGRVVAELLHLDAKARDLAVAVGVFRVDLVKLLLETAKAREPFWLKHKERHGDERQTKHPDREGTFEEVFRAGHRAPIVPRKLCAVPLLGCSVERIRYSVTVTFALARSLLMADAVTPATLAEALLLAATRRTSLIRALIGMRAIDPIRLEPILERGEAPFMRHIAPVTSLVQRLPAGLCDRLFAIPVREDSRTGTVDVAVVDARDPHPVEEIGHWLKAPVRLVRTSISSMEAALLAISGRPEGDTDIGMRALAPPIWAPAPAPAPVFPGHTPAYGVPAFDARSLQDPHTLPGGFERDSEMAIPLTRRNLGPDPIIELSPEAARRARRDTDPILYLKRRKLGTLNLGDPLAGLEDRTDPAIAPPAPAHRTDPAPPPELSSVLGFADVIEAMDEAHDRDRILDLLVSGVRRIARRVAVLAVRRDALVGWTGSAELADRARLRTVRLVNAMRTVLHEALDREGAELVRVPKDAAHAPLLSIMTPPPSGSIGLAAVRTEGKSIAVVFAADFLEPAAPSASVERMAYLAHAAGESLGRLLRERRK